MDTMFFKRTTNWTYHPTKGIVCSGCKTPVNIKKAEKHIWKEACQGCESNRRWNQGVAFIIGMLLVVVYFSYKGWL